MALRACAGIVVGCLGGAAGCFVDGVEAADDEGPLGAARAAASTVYCGAGCPGGFHVVRKLVEQDCGGFGPPDYTNAVQCEPDR